MIAKVLIFFASILAACLVSCSHIHPYRNVVFEKGTSKDLSYSKAFHFNQRSNEMMVFMAFSGGGTRAASMAYGVLETLDEVYFTPESKHFNSQRYEHTFLDEVDSISSVSGGSFTAAYYGLFGKRIFTDFSQRFLERQVGRRILLRLAMPYNWFRLASPWFNRSEVAIEFYDELLFDRATFRDFDPSILPVIQIQATDIDLGRGFSFSPEHFRLICSDLADFPIARAVAASAAFPGVFSAISLKNHADKCGKPPRGWIDIALQERDHLSRRFHYAKDMSNYLNTEMMPNLYLLDGGISDNLGIRGPLDSTLSFASGMTALSQMGMESTESFVFVIVNAQTRRHRGFSLLEATPGLGDILDSTSTVMINRYNFETVALLRESLAHLKLEVDAYRKAKGIARPFNYYVIEVTFDSLDNDAERHYFSVLPTSLGLPKGKVREIRRVAKRLLLQSSEFQRLVQDLHLRVPIVHEIVPINPKPPVDVEEPQ